ncbi:hypothetical protein Tco_1531950 [Tanacetum coccineum]
MESGEDMKWDTVQEGYDLGLTRQGGKVPQVSNFPLGPRSRYQKRCLTVSSHMANSLVVVVALHSAWPSVLQLTLVVESWHSLPPWLSNVRPDPSSREPRGFLPRRQQ